MHRALLAAVCLCVASSAGAAPRHVLGRAITDLVSGATVAIDTPMGTQLPVRFSSDGSMSGEARDLAGYLGRPTDSGRWWVANDQLCSKWNRWFDGETHCLRLKRDGKRIHWRRQDGTTGTATLTATTHVAQATSKPLPLRTPNREQAPPSEPEAGRTAPGMPRDTPPRDPEAGAVPPAADLSRLAPVALAQSPSPHAGVRIVNRPPPPPPAPDPSSPDASTPAPHFGQRATQSPDPAPLDLGPDRLASVAGLVMAVANVARNDVLNVRLGPSADETIVGAIAPTERDVLVTGPCREQWCPIRHRSLQGWVNSRYLAGENLGGPDESERSLSAPRTRRDGREQRPAQSRRDEAPRTCLTPAARDLLDRIEARFGSVRVISTCRSGATIAGSGRPSRHASGNAVDFDAGDRKGQIVEWLAATHRSGGTMTYPGMDHVHVDIGPHFVSLAGKRTARR